MPDERQQLIEGLKICTSSIGSFTRLGGLRLRGYQLEVANAILDSVLSGRGHTIVVQLPRQSGKNEVQAQVEAYLMMVYCGTRGEIVKVSPTWKPQTVNAMRRLERVLGNNKRTMNWWKKEQGYIYRLIGSSIYFLSGEPTTSVVGATASTLLACDEAQDVLPAKWDKDFLPMAASTNATRVLWGTAWTSNTLLARERQAALEAQKKDGLRRVFVLTAEDVAREVPAYGEFVRQQVLRLGRMHPIVRTQYYGEEIDSQGGLFPPERRALMQGWHPPQLSPTPGGIYALLVDVGGEEHTPEMEGGGSAAAPSGSPGGRRDSTALTVVQVDPSTSADPLLRADTIGAPTLGAPNLGAPMLGAPTYRVVHRRLWTGVKHTSLYTELRALALHWNAWRVVVDATGLGAGLAAFLERALGRAGSSPGALSTGKVTPFVFNQATKSRLGWSFVALVDAGRYKEPALQPGEAGAAEQALFFTQCELCRFDVGKGPSKSLQWGVPEGQRHPLTGELLHDDLLLSASLCAVLDEENWPRGEARSAIVPGFDPLDEMEF